MLQNNKWRGESAQPFPRDPLGHPYFSTPRDPALDPIEQEQQFWMRILDQAGAANLGQNLPSRKTLEHDLRHEIKSQKNQVQNQARRARGMEENSDFSDSSTDESA